MSAFCVRANKHRCILRRPRFFPLLLEDIGDIHDPSVAHYEGWDDGNITVSVHWTLLVEVVSYQHQSSFAGRPEILCKDVGGQVFKVVGYFQQFDRRNLDFDARIAPAIKPGCVLAIRYAESKTFADGTTGIRLEDGHVPFVRTLPCSLTQLLDAADRVFGCKPKNPAACWGSCGKCDGEVTADGSPVTLSLCGRCKKARYCSQACQSEDWAKSHKSQCKLVGLVLDLAGQGAQPFELNKFTGKWQKFV
jgi:hypothetical protein